MNFLIITNNIEAMKTQEQKHILSMVEQEYVQLIKREMADLNRRIEALERNRPNTNIE